jgi:hypothetical protein
MWLQHRSTQSVVAPCAALVLLAGALLALAGCATTAGSDKGVQVRPLSAVHYAPTQTVDVLNAEPARPHEALAELALTDPTGTATSSQLTAQLIAAARQLGADALVVEHVAQPAPAGVAFNPAGGQMQDASTGGVLSISAQAIRYTH